MSRTDGVLLKKINEFPEEKIVLANFITLLIWATLPIIMLALNVFKVNSYTYYGIISVIFYLIGGSGIIFGGIQLLNSYMKQKKGKSALLQELQPIIILFLLFIWSVICTAFADEKRIAIYGYEMLRDNLFTFFFMGGVVLSTISVLSNKKLFKKLICVFFFVSFVVSILCFLGLGLGRIFSPPIGMAINEAAKVGFNNDVQGYLFFSILSIAWCEFAQKNFTVKSLLLVVCGFELITFMKAQNVKTMICLLTALITLCVISIYIKKCNVMGAVIPLAFMTLVCAIFITVSPTFSISACKQLLFDDLKSSFAHWEAAKDVIRAKPIVGVGPQNILQSATSFLLQMGMYLGIPSVVLFLASIISLLDIFVRKIYTSEYIASFLLLIFVLINITINGSAYYIYANFFILFGLCFKLRLDILRNIEYKQTIL